MAATPHWTGQGKTWKRGPHGWREETKQCEIIVESIQINQVRKIIEMFLRSKRQKAFANMHTCLSAAPVSKCSAKESVMWLQISSHGSKECHGYTTLGELLRRLRLTGSVWQQGRFHYVICLTELIVQKRFSCLSGTARKHLFKLIETLVQRVLETHECIRQMKQIVRELFQCLLKKKYQIDSRVSWFQEVDCARKWISKLNLLTVAPRLDLQLSISGLPVELQRHIVRMLSDHKDIESLSCVNKTFNLLCRESSVWRSLCFNHFTQKQIEECENMLKRRKRKTPHDDTDITWSAKYYFMIKRFEREENFADPLLLCKRCCIVFWQESGHPCVAADASFQYERVTPKQLISFF